MKTLDIPFTPSPSDLARFKKHYVVEGECWLWQGPLYKGYGRFWLGTAYQRQTGTTVFQSTIPSHRASYFLFNGPIPEDTLVCHTCDVPHCVNPAHLWLGTPMDNMVDRDLKGRAAMGNKNGSRLYPERLRRGEAAKGSKLTEDQVREIRKAWVYRKVTLQQLADKYGVNFTGIHKIVTRQTWKHIV